MAEINFNEAEPASIGKDSVLALRDWIDDLQLTHDGMKMLLSLETGLDQQGVLLNTVKLLAATIDRKLDDGRRLLPSAD
ncbi:hypothetical protein WK78_17630 [Burkholderia cepacia]|uniref:hypothetical protein n=1 Tax=Burkholderia cepacia complex TaxID=87882 RepID=UPI00075F5EAF|nr:MULTISPECIES: hypothetical protein [Burkholderia cepacia complex]KVV25298.1 hypothetical protein WK78_17630 [Burkholderia cepacia]MEB2609725.1 hypothetical protein [Burkholderia cenocepacia]